MKKKHRFSTDWDIRARFEDDHLEIRDREGRRIAIMASQHPQGPRAEDVNARLICAANDVCEALFKLLDRIHKDKDSKSWFKKEQSDALSALFKAGYIEK